MAVFVDAGGSPLSLRILVCTPKNGRPAEPGLSGVAPGSGTIMRPPVSVCHHVSTSGTRALADVLVVPHPAEGLIGSPTEPMTRRLGIGCFSVHSVPWPMSERMTVGAV